MPELDEVTYSRDACVAAVRDYYEFLTKVYLKDSQVIQPPEGGWPSIVNANPSILENLGKTDEVISLLAHLPYLRSYRDGTRQAHAAAECYFADWQDLFSDLAGRSTSDQIRSYTEGHLREVVPPHVVGLAGGARDNPLILLDTELGIIHWHECPFSVRLNPSREAILDHPLDYAPENEVDWRCDSPAWAIADFFELFKDQFRELNWIPLSPHAVLDIEIPGQQGEEGLVPMLADIYRRHGWPDLARYRKDECVAAVRKALKERYPSAVDYRGE
ncbi:hypothetical protein F4779DRAFT_598215 [Xylariaceae sp. FL0662B]|nr:hypothetical protein F4779DRAFT_598215 [Xylariaceae sp. FL0662B]